ncbi:FMN-binding protein [Leifsonia aquatica]|uniref:FMN-binding protein n=1 Tax=Leifsonia aquatica TaxID=144185 RepID=UPI0028A99A8E|nr:FMN-binding protein [Leifsonia aquatica]
MRRKWRGTILFAVIMVVMGATVGLRLYDLGETQTSASATSTSTGTASSAGSSTGSSTASGGATATSPSASATATPSATPSTAAASATKTITGAVEQNRYGSFQVQVTFSGSTITAVQVLQSPGDRRSQEINQQATPILEQEAIAAQSANIDTVSGATYTSESYMQSLQSAIDQL